jgi:hypothetical protein
MVCSLAAPTTARKETEARAARRAYEKRKIISPRTGHGSLLVLELLPAFSCISYRVLFVRGVILP